MAEVAAAKAVVTLSFCTRPCICAKLRKVAAIFKPKPYYGLKRAFSKMYVLLLIGLEVSRDP